MTDPTVENLPADLREVLEAEGFTVESVSRMFDSDEPLTDDTLLHVIISRPLDLTIVGEEPGVGSITNSQAAAVAIEDVSEGRNGHPGCPNVILEIAAHQPMGPA